MRGERMFKILSALENSKEAAIDVLGSYLIAGISHNPTKSMSAAGQFLDSRKGNKTTQHEKREQTRRFYSMVRYLEEDGLVRKEYIAGMTNVSITEKGKKKLEILRTSYSVWLPSSKYQNDMDDKKTSDNVASIVTFDIPEKERAKRDWLRCALNNMDFDMVHKSVWMGTGQIPVRFLEDLRDMKMGDYIEIFAITKMGSLKKINMK